jgi:hypothetical protein
MVISIDEIQGQDELADLVEWVVVQRHAIRDKILKKLPEIHAMAEANLLRN